MRRFFCAAFVLLACAGLARAQEQADPLTGKAAFGGWRADRPGTWRLIRPGDLQQPAESTSSGADRVRAPKGTGPQVPQGFSAERIASGIRNPRAVRVAPRGDLFVADSRAGQVRTYRLGKDGKVAEEGIFAKGLARPYGIAFHPADDPQWVYVADTGGVVRFPYRKGDMKASAEPQTVVADLPTGGHWRPRPTGIRRRRSSTQPCAATPTRACSPSIRCPSSPISRATGRPSSRATRPWWASCARCADTRG